MNEIEEAMSQSVGPDHRRDRFRDVELPQQTSCRMRSGSRAWWQASIRLTAKLSTPSVTTTVRTIAPKSRPPDGRNRCKVDRGAEQHNHLEQLFGAERDPLLPALLRCPETADGDPEQDRGDLTNAST